MWAVALLFVLVTPLSGQEGITVLVAAGDEETREPLEGVRVVFPELDQTRLTDEDGAAVFRNVPPGTYRMEASRVGYRPAEGTVDVTGDGREEMAVLLAPAPVEMPGLDVAVDSDSWVAGFLRRKDELEGHFLTKKDIEERDPVRLSQMIRDYPQVQIRYDPRHGRRALLHSPADNRSYCEPALVLDGTVTPDFISLDDIEPERVIAMEVYWKRSELTREDIRPPLELGDGSSGSPLSVYGAPPTREPMDVVEGRFTESAAPEDPGVDGSPGPVGGRRTGAGPIMDYCGAIYVWTTL